MKKMFLALLLCAAIPLTSLTISSANDSTLENIDTGKEEAVQVFNLDSMEDLQIGESIIKEDEYGITEITKIEDLDEDDEVEFRSWPGGWKSTKVQKGVGNGKYYVSYSIKNILSGGAFGSASFSVTINNGKITKATDTYYRMLSKVTKTDITINQPTTATYTLTMTVGNESILTSDGIFQLRADLNVRNKTLTTLVR